MQVESNSNITKQIFFEAFFKGQSVKTDESGGIVLPTDSPVTAGQMGLYESVKDKVEEVASGNPGAVTVIVKMFTHLKEQKREHEIVSYVDHLLDTSLTGEGLWIFFKECDNDIKELFSYLDERISGDEEE